MTDRQTQTAELLKLLGGETADAVLSCLPDNLSRTLRQQMQEPEPAEIKIQEKRDILRDFESFFGFALKSSPNAMRVFPQDGEGDEEGGKEAAGATATAAAAEEAKSRPIKLTGDALADLELLSVHQLSGALESEQPRTVAILLNSMSPQLAANVLSYFSDGHRGLVTKQLSKEQNAPQLLVERIARATVQRGLTLPADEPDRRDHVDRLGEVMREVPKSYRKDMLAAIEEEDAELSAALLKKLYEFEDLVGLEPQQIQQILGEVDATTLTTAMFQADEEVVDAILGNLSKRARQTIEEELQFQTRVPESKVTEARDAVAELIAKLDQEAE